MTLFDQISEDIKSAMKARDKVRLETLRNIKKVFLEAKTAPRHIGRCRCAEDHLQAGQAGQGDGSDLHTGRSSGLGRCRVGSGGSLRKLSAEATLSGGDRGRGEEDYR